MRVVIAKDFFPVRNTLVVPMLPEPNFLMSFLKKTLVMIKPNGIILWHDYVPGKKSAKDVVRYINEISKITIEYSQIDFPQNLTFPIKIPEGYRKININELLQ